MRAREGRKQRVKICRSSVCSCPNPDCLNNRMNLMNRISHAVYECLVCLTWFDRETGTIIREGK